MSNEIVTDELIHRILRALGEHVSLKKESITYEIQDDGQCIMFYIPVDEVPEAEWPLICERVGAILNDIVPGRQGDYSWFATFTDHGNRVDSCFGGNLDFPNSVF
ncbi:MAG: hypothetical protein V4582_23365 [Pseudomonadota bacterium]